MTAGGNSLEIQLAIGRVAMGILTEPYRGVKDPEFEPPRGTIMHDAWHGKKLSQRHQEAWRLTLDLFLQAAGKSPKGSSFSDAGGGGDGADIPTVYSNFAQRSLERLRDQHLHTHEWRLMHMLILEAFNGGKLYRLQHLGSSMSGYKDEAQARSSGVTSIHRLLDSLCEFHGI